MTRSDNQVVLPMFLAVRDLEPLRA